MALYPYRRTWWKEGVPYFLLPRRSAPSGSGPRGRSCGKKRFLTTLPLGNHDDWGSDALSAGIGGGVLGCYLSGCAYPAQDSLAFLKHVPSSCALSFVSGRRERVVNAFEHLTL